MGSIADIERRIRLLELKRHADSPITPACIRFADTDFEIKQAMDEFKSLSKNTPRILIHTDDASMERK